MQYVVYRNKGNAACPYLLDVQSDIIAELNTRIVIPLYPTDRFNGKPAQRLNPLLSVNGQDFLIMTHELASVRLSMLGEKVADVSHERHRIKEAINFIYHGF